MSKKCAKIHKMFSSKKRYFFLYKDNNIPLNGIYILYEKGEFGHSTDRIVRIGTHTGTDQLCSRLKEHFVKENKDRSIFRKNIGRALLNKRRDPFLKQWDIDLTTTAAKNKYSELGDPDKQYQIEKLVSRYIQDNFSFVVIEIKDKDKRLDLESKLISTVSLCEECKLSAKWLGQFSPKVKIRESGLWQINGLYGTLLSDEDIKLL